MVKDRTFPKVVGFALVGLVLVGFALGGHTFNNKALGLGRDIRALFFLIPGRKSPEAEEDQYDDHPEDAEYQESLQVVSIAIMSVGSRLHFKSVDRKEGRWLSPNNLHDSPVIRRVFVILRTDEFSSYRARRVFVI